MLNSAMRAPHRMWWLVVGFQVAAGATACSDEVTTTSSGSTTTSSGSTTSTTGSGGGGGNGNTGGSGGSTDAGGAGGEGTTTGSGGEGGAGGSANTGGTGGSANTGGAGGSANTGGAGGSANTGGAGGSANTGGAGGEGGSYIGPCDQDPQGCGNAQEGCIGCAYQTVCSSQLNACASSLECILYIACADPCTNQACIDNCTALHQAGASLFGDLADCVICQECRLDCAGTNVHDPYPGCP